MTAMIEVSGLQKFYGRFEALKGISFSVGKGEIVGFLGPNGAGKSTTMKILTGYIAPTVGSFSVAGYDGYRQSLQVRRSIGYLPENAPMYPDMGIIEYLKFVCSIRKLGRSEAKKRIYNVVERVGLGPMIQKNIGELSKGFKQRVGLAQALIHEPPVLILDEPTSGLDPNQIVEIRELIKELGKDRTIILSTHNLPEVRMTCDRMIIIFDGKKVADGTFAEFERRGAAGIRYVVGVKASEAVTASSLQEQLSALAMAQSATLISAQDGTLTVSVDFEGDADHGGAIYGLATASGWQLNELRRDVLDLEKVFHNLTQY